MEELNIEELLRTEQDLNKVIAILQRGRLTPMPDYVKYGNMLDPEKHDVMNPAKRPNKIVNVDPDSPDYGVTRSIMVNASENIGEKQRIELVTRIALAMQKLIVKRASGITFGNRPKYKSTTENELEETLYKAVMRVLKDNKEGSLNRKVAYQIYGMTEAAERWYVTEGKDVHTNYSPVGTKYKIRVVVFSPLYGDVLYPFFDENRDMVAFSRLFKKVDENGVEHSFFETLTADTFYMWENSSNGWVMREGYPKSNPYGKIPVIYGCQEKAEYEDVQTLIDRLEKLLSNFGDTNDYHGSPKIVAKGHVNSFCKKGEAGAILELDADQNADLKYLEWQHAPESIKQEYSTLKELIHTLTQTPDLSWETVKGLNVSGVALQLMFMDAVLKVKDKEEIWIDYLTRRCNLLKAMLAHIDKTSFEDAAISLEIDPEIVPYIVLDEQQRTNIELSLAGNKQLKSRRTAMRDLGIDNIDEEVSMIEEEEEAANMFEQNEPTLA